jgi:hypothetical protein
MRLFVFIQREVKIPLFRRLKMLSIILIDQMMIIYRKESYIQSAIIQSCSLKFMSTLA